MIIQDKIIKYILVTKILSLYIYLSIFYSIFPKNLFLPYKIKIHNFNSKYLQFIKIIYFFFIYFEKKIIKYNNIFLSIFWKLFYIKIIYLKKWLKVIKILIYIKWITKNWKFNICIIIFWNHFWFSISR